MRPRPALAPFASLLALLLAATTVIAAPAAQAQLSGAVVRLTARYPQVDAVFNDPGTRTVSAGIEWPKGTLFNYAPFLQVDIGDDYIEFYNTYFEPVTVQGAGFNGFALEVLTGPAIISAVPEDGSDFFPKSVWYDAERLYIDFANVVEPANSRARLRLTTGAVPVPEPATWLTMVAGFALAGAALRRRRAPAVSR